MSPELPDRAIEVNPCAEAGTKLECLWRSPLSVPKASSHEIHVWRIYLDLPADQIHQLEKILSPDEQLRANRFHFERHKRRFIVSRASLRKTLGYYLESDPSRLEFSYGPRGKPVLASTNDARKLCFNMSHSNELALCVVTRNCSIGVDLEYIRPNPDVELLAKNFFFSREYEAISVFPPDRKQKEFFNLWTLKEAFLKATGEGLRGLEHIEVSVSPWESQALLGINGTNQTTCRWSIVQLIPAQDYTAAIAVEGEDWRFHLWQYELDTYSLEN